ncbi:MAG: outer membrane beta-barrel domain-containing protein [Pseudomonadota bacterium]|nr:MAG: outer membrane beta-barrel domain-containing protein [Pseudomonadota bacterium]
MVMLQRTLACLVLCGALGTAYAQDVVPDLGPEEVIAPEVARREVEVPKIKSNDYELGIYLGMYSVEDFGTNPLAGLYFAYHLTEDIFLGGLFGYSPVSDDTSQFFESATGQPISRLVDDTLSYYEVFVGYTFLPGEVYTGEGKGWTTTGYVMGGLGSTELNDESNFTIMLGVGMRFVPIEWLAVHVDARDHVFGTDAASGGLGGTKTTHNLELSTGVTFFF